MPPRDPTVTPVPDTLEGLKSYVSALRADYDSHNHDGANSKRFRTVRAETLSSRATSIRKISYTDNTNGFWVGLVGAAVKFFLGGLTDYIKFDGSTGFLTIKATNSNLKIYQAIVDASGNGDYATVAAALAAGKTSIYVRNGTYSSEPKWNINTAETLIEGESKGGVSISFASGASSVNIAMGANGIQLRTMTLLGYTNQILVQNGSSTQIVIDNCYLQAYGTGSVINSAAAMTVKDCYIDALSSNTSTWSFAGSCTNCLFSNCTIDLGSTTGTSTVVDGGSQNIFSQCRFLSTGNKTSTYSGDAQTIFSNCYFQSGRYNFSGNVQNCVIVGNGAVSLAAQAFINLTSFQSRMMNNTIDTKDSAGEGLIYILAYNCIFDENYVKDIHQIYMGPGTNIYACSLQNNNIISKIAAGSALTLTISGDVHYSNIIGNVLRNNASGDTPVVTNSGVSCNVSSNIVITA
jgi:hypothetical protein